MMKEPADVRFGNEEDTRSKWCGDIETGGTPGGVADEGDIARFACDTPTRQLADKFGETETCLISGVDEPLTRHMANDCITDNDELADFWTSNTRLTRGFPRLMQRSSRLTRRTTRSPWHRRP